MTPAATTVVPEKAIDAMGWPGRRGITKHALLYIYPIDMYEVKVSKVNELQHIHGYHNTSWAYTVTTGTTLATRDLLIP
jgi:hypothetical protein